MVARTSTPRPRRERASAGAVILRGQVDDDRALPAPVEPVDGHAREARREMKKHIDDAPAQPRERQAARTDTLEVGQRSRAG